MSKSHCTRHKSPSLATKVCASTVDLYKLLTVNLVYIAMSGGVDSSVAAMILKENYGPEMLQPVFVETWNPYLLTPLTKLERNRPYNRANVSLKPIARDEKCGEKDFQRVKEIADFMGLPEPIRMDFHRRYWNDVFEPMLRAYAEGLTPNPDLACNAHVKFGELMTQLILKVKYMAESERPKKVWLATGKLEWISNEQSHSYYSIQDTTLASHG